MKANYKTSNYECHPNYPKMKEWSNKVKERDNYTCQHCGTTESVKMSAHHIKSKYKYPELRYDITNGITVCMSCHMKIHNTGKTISDETKQKMSESHIGKHIKKAIQQIDIETFEVINEYDSMTKASKQTGINQGNISLVCSGKIKSAGNYIWRYSNNS